MTGHLDLVFLGDGDDPLEPVIQAFPHLVGIGCAAFEVRQPRLGRISGSAPVEQFGIVERRQRRAPSTGGAGRTHVTQRCRVVVEPSESGFARHPDDVDHQVDLALPLVARPVEDLSRVRVIQRIA